MSAPTTTNTRVLRLLTRAAFEGRGGLDLVYWGASKEGPVQLVFPGRETLFFLPRDVESQGGRRRPVELRSFGGQSVDALYFRSLKERRREAERLMSEGTPPFEYDVKPADRFLMERFITAGCSVMGPMEKCDGHVRFVNPKITPLEFEAGSEEASPPQLRVASIDVESEGLEGKLISVAIVCGDEEWVIAARPGPSRAGVRYFESEAEALNAFVQRMAELDPDVIIGWNVIDFDLVYLEARCKRHRIRFNLGRGNQRAALIEVGGRPDGGASGGSVGRSRRSYIARLPGRMVLDGISTLRTATWSFERWGLEYVAQELLGRGKKLGDTSNQVPGDALAKILHLAEHDMAGLIEYNLEDCRLVRDIFTHTHALEFTLERQRLTGLCLDRRAGSVAAFDHLYLPRLHRAGRVAPTTGTSSMHKRSPGGFVMDSQPGLHRNVLVLDFKSLYPSIIRTFLIDPLGLILGLESRVVEESVEGFLGARFAREGHILPGLIESLWAARDAAKRDKDAALSRAIKILMNSFYGVMGTEACRFFDPRLASSITRRGHELLQKSRRWIETQGLSVIYGDTDSLFVLLGSEHSSQDCAEVGEQLAQGINESFRQELVDEHRLESALELQFETHFTRFLMPTMRHSTKGSKKRYAGMARSSEGEEHLVIKGLEAVRTDWTPLARRVQRELIERVFSGRPYQGWVRELSTDLFKGKLDEELVYHKRLRRELSEYGASAPPHVAAARQLGRPLREISYVQTLAGPQPLEQVTSELDYHHYMLRQLAPAADVILPFMGHDFMALGGRQLSLF